MKKYFTKLALIIGCVGSMCFLGGNTLASSRGEVCNFTRKSVIKKYKSDFDELSEKNKFAFNECMDMACNKSIDDIFDDIKKLYSKNGVRSKTIEKKEIFKVFETGDVHEEEMLWEAFWDSYIGELVSTYKSAFDKA